jgi:hypothetical protein
VVNAIATSTTALPTSFPSGWAYQGCWVDGVNGRILDYQQPDNQALTLQSCVDTCTGLGYTIAGAEWSIQCFCDDYIENGGVLATAQTDCDMPCGGNSAEICGAGNRMSIYSIGSPKVLEPPAVQTTDLPTDWVYSGCLQSVYTAPCTGFPELTSSKTEITSIK